MHVDIISKKDNMLFGRKEITAKVGFDKATPNRKELREHVATKLGLNPELTVVRDVKSAFGTKELAVVVYSYADLETLKKTEPGYVRKRDNVAPPPEKKKKEKKGAAKKPGK